MKRRLRIAVADDEPEMLDFFDETLSRLGHTVVARATSGGELIERCREVQPDLVVTDVKMHDSDGIDAARLINRDRPTPVVLVSAFHDEETVDRAGDDYVLAYLVKPIKANNLEPAIAIAVRRFEQFEALRNEASDLRQALEDRKVIERAKGMLMRGLRLEEAEAFRRLQATARAHQKKLVETAHLLLSLEETVFQDKPAAK